MDAYDLGGKRKNVSPAWHARLCELQLLPVPRTLRHPSLALSPELATPHYLAKANYCLLSFAQSGPFSLGSCLADSLCLASFQSPSKCSFCVVFYKTSATHVRQMYAAHMSFITLLQHHIATLLHTCPPSMTMTPFHLLPRPGSPQGLGHTVGTQNGY